MKRSITQTLLRMVPARPELMEFIMAEDHPEKSPDNTDQFGRPIEIDDDDYDEPPQRTYVPPSPPPHTNGASYDDEIPFD